MKRSKRLVMADRLDGATLSLGCTTCVLFTQCGGYTRVGGAWSCADGCDACDRDTCDIVCPSKPAQFVRDYNEIGGFGFGDIPKLNQQKIPLPHHIPTVQHRMKGPKTPVPLNWAAIPLNKLLLSYTSHSRPIADTSAEIRLRFGLTPSTKIILLGTGPDQPIEDYWHWELDEDIPQALQRLDLEVAITPNFSLFSGDPRTQHMFNRKRSLLCAHRWSEAGLRTVPYVQALAGADWDYWLAFLRAHPEISIVAKEFQTGGSIRITGNDMVDKLAWLQESLKRDLHVIAIAGARYIARLKHHFSSRWTIIDSQPWWNAAHYRAAAIDRDRIRWERVANPDEPLADLFLTNVSTYSTFIDRCGSSPE